jgi:sulfate adenylyltransferase subunit 2
LFRSISREAPDGMSAMAMLLMVDDDRVSAEPRRSAGRTLDPVPHTGLLSADRRGRKHAKTLPEVIQEMLLTTTSERQGRVIDKDAGGAGMEVKKQQGYF